MRVVTRYALAYARHAGLSEEGIGAEVERRLARLEPWAQGYVAASAMFTLWVAPLVFLGRLRSFERLGETEREDLLARLLRARPWLRTLFLGARALALAACYGRSRR